MVWTALLLSFVVAGAEFHTQKGKSLHQISTSLSADRGPKITNQPLPELSSNVSATDVKNQASGSFTIDRDHDSGSSVSKQDATWPPPLGKCRLGSCSNSRFDLASQKWLSPRSDLPPEGHEEWDRRHLEDMSNLEKSVAQNTIVLLGDSITENWARPFRWRFKGTTPDKDYIHGPLRLVAGKGLLAEGVVPFAIAGDRIADLAYRLFELGGAEALHKLSPTTVILTIGTNDFMFGKDVPVAVNEMKLFIQQLQAALPPETHLVLQAPLPNGPYADVWDASNPAYIYFDHLIGVLRGHAHGKTSYLDCSGAFLHNGHQIELNVFHPDKTHLVSPGYQHWGSCMEKQLGVPLLKATTHPGHSGTRAGCTIHVGFGLIFALVASSIVGCW